MTDLVQRIRQQLEYYYEPDYSLELLDEAANKIEELEEVLAQKQLSLERQMEATDYWMKKATCLALDKT